MSTLSRLWRCVWGEPPPRIKSVATATARRPDDGIGPIANTVAKSLLVEKTLLSGIPGVMWIVRGNGTTTLRCSRCNVLLWTLTTHQGLPLPDGLMEAVHAHRCPDVGEGDAP